MKLIRRGHKAASSIGLPWRGGDGVPGKAETDAAPAFLSYADE